MIAAKKFADTGHSHGTVTFAVSNAGLFEDELVELGLKMPTSGDDTPIVVGRDVNNHAHLMDYEFT